MRPVPLVLAIAFSLASGASLAAHPTAASFVVIDLATPKSLVVSVTTDAAPLLMKLEALAGTRVTDAAESKLRTARIDEQLRELSPVLIDQLHLELNGVRTPLAIASIDRRRDKPEQVVIALTAVVPSGSAILTWRSSLFYGSYPIAVRAGGTAAAPAEEDYDWLAGSEQSRAYDLTSLATTVNSRLAHLIGIGFTHIVPGGLDHVLFVLGLFLLASTRRALLLQISAFTVAHSCTLALAVLGWLSVPASVVEPLIAVSIAYIAIENLVTTRLSRWRVGVVFAFGLLHGVGFAGALSSLGLSRAHLASTLIGFNVGVELGQIAVVVAAAVVVRVLAIRPEARHRVVVRPVSAVIAAMGIFWAVQRVVS